MTVLRLQARERVMGRLRMPEAAAKTMRTRRARVWGVECWRSKAWSTACCGGLTVMASGSGPAMRYPPIGVMHEFRVISSPLDRTRTLDGFPDACTSYLAETLLIA